MTDSLTIFGDNFTGVTGIKATGTGNGTLTYIRPTGTKSITENGTDIDVTNYASVDVEVSGGGSAPTLLYSGTLGEISTSSTTAETVTTINLGSTAWDYTKILYISIWRTTGRYSTPQAPSSSNQGFLGTETFYLGGGQVYQYGQDEPSHTTPSGFQILRYANGYYVYLSTTAYGVYPSDLTKQGVLTISKKYNSTYSGTVTGSYDIAVYQIEYPIGDPWFGRFS